MTQASSGIRKSYVCVHCGHAINRELYRKYSNSLKTIHCDNCKQIADEYIEFEPLLTLVDAMLLSQGAFRHMIYNENFKLYWKLSLVLVILESFALWRRKRIEDPQSSQTLHEKGFYICSLQNIADHLSITFILFIVTFLINVRKITENGPRKFLRTLLKAVALSNLSKFFLLPVLVWRENTTDFGRRLHYILVTGHHLCMLVLVYNIVNGLNKRWLSFMIVIPAFLLKEYLRNCTMSLVDTIF